MNDSGESEPSASGEAVRRPGGSTKWTLRYQSRDGLDAPLCRHCGKPKTPGWTDDDVWRGKRFNTQTNTLEYHCYERFIED